MDRAVARIESVRDLEAHSGSQAAQAGPHRAVRAAPAFHVSPASPDSWLGARATRNAARVRCSSRTCASVSRVPIAITSRMGCIGSEGMRSPCTFSHVRMRTSGGFRSERSSASSPLLRALVFFECKPLGVSLDGLGRAASRGRLLWERPGWRVHELLQSALAVLTLTVKSFGARFRARRAPRCARPTCEQRRTDRHSGVH